ncbi:MAG: hypothetical protein ACYC61_06320 [Isosphaeraceae bacterium]
MKKPLFARARLISPRGLSGLAVFSGGLLGQFVFLSWVDSRLGLNEPRRYWVMNYPLLFFAAIHYALFRSVLFHPVFRPGYRTWLELTPWTYRKPLPLGPVELVWEDGLFLGPLILICNLLPLSLAPQLLCTFLLVHLVAVDVSLWLTRSRGFAYATAFGLGLAVWTCREPIACLVVLAATYAVAYEGLRQALARFPWYPPGEARPMQTLFLKESFVADLMGFFGAHREPCGWPHDRMMADVVRCPGIRRIDAFLGTALGCWWFYALVSLLPEPRARHGISAVGFILVILVSAILRFGGYFQGYIGPLSLWARIRTNRWVIPSFDRLFVAPACTLLAGLAALVLLGAFGVPEPARFTVAGGMAALAALITPPRLREWRLTGGHRIIPTKDSGMGAKYRMIETN